VASPSADPLLNVHLDGRYHLERLASEEMLGRVYVARDLQNGKLVQVKVLNPNLTADSEKFHRFGREITVTRMVRHPHTMQILDWGHQGDVHYLVLEYLTASTLAEVLAEGPMPPERVASVVAQVAQAIGAAHQEGIVHRNLSPQNILLLDNTAKGDFVKVRDFGLSRLERFDDDGTNLTQAGARVGNVSYMAPEYIEDDRVHPKGDLYALGALTFHMLVGHPPYQGRAVQVLSAHVTDDPPVPSQARPGLPAWCDELVASLMARQPEDRPGAYQIVQHIEAGLGRSVGAGKLLSIDEDGEVVRPSRAPYYVAMVGTAVLVAGLVLLVLTVGAAGLYALWTRVPDMVAAGPEAREEGLVPSPEAVAPVGVAPDPAPEVAPEPPPATSTPSPRAPAAKPSQPPTTKPAPEPQGPPAVGAVKVRANRRVLVYVDGNAVGYTPLDHPVPAGRYEVSVLVPGNAESRQSQTVELQSGDRTVEFTF
jgi:hypothetical protein